jgi:hypothetical protein
MLLHAESHSGDQWVSLALVDGYLEFRYSLGTVGPLLLVAPAPIVLGQWHSVKVQ